MQAGTMRGLRRVNGNRADRTGEEREAAQKDLGNKELQKTEAKQKARAGTNAGKSMEEQQEQEIKFLSIQETGNAERMNLCAALP